MQLTPKGILGKFEEEVEKGVKSQVKQTAQAVKSQFGAQNKPAPQTSQDTGTQEAGGHQTQQGQTPQQQDQFTKEFIQDLYAPSNPHQQQHGYSNNQQNQPSKFFQKQIEEGKTAEEAASLEALRKKLHDETYYIPLTHRKAQQEEERPAEKVEREKMEDLQLEEDKKNDKPPPLAVQMGTNRAEQFPGVSG